MNFGVVVLIAFCIGFFLIPSGTIPSTEITSFNDLFIGILVSFILMLIPLIIIKSILSGNKSNQVDDIARAELYLFYGRKKHACNILKLVLVEDPDNVKARDLLMKLESEV